MFYFISLFWFLRQIRAVLFWLYLWQLKEYHISRFLDHFRTHKGKEIFFNRLFLLKVLLLFYALALFFWPKTLAWQFYAFWIFILAALYVAETAKFFLGVLKKDFKKPVFTQKMVFLTLASFAVLLAFLAVLFYLLYGERTFYIFVLGLLAFDILTPFVISGVVLLFQPFAVYIRNRIIKQAKEKRRKFKNLTVVGITGSYGKTSTKEFLAKILEEGLGKDKVLKTKEHQNSEMGVSGCILKELKDSHEVFVVEMGAYKKGGIKLLCDIAKPKIGIVTGVNEQHLATFGTIDNLLSAEGGEELAESLPKDGIIFLNAKNQHCQDLFKRLDIDKRLYGEKTKTAGLENIEGAKSAAKALGVSEKAIERAVRQIGDKFPGIEIKKGKGGLNIVDASYSANPDGVMAHLEYLKTSPGKKVIVMPCLIELGKASAIVHEKIGKSIAKMCDLAIITTKDRLKELRKEGGSKIVFIQKPEEIFKKLESFCVSGDTVLLEGRVPEGLTKLLIDKDD